MKKNVFGFTVVLGTVGMLLSGCQSQHNDDSSIQAAQQAIVDYFKKDNLDSTLGFNDQGKVSLMANGNYRVIGVFRDTLNSTNESYQDGYEVIVDADNNVKSVQIFNPDGTPWK